MRNYFNVVKAIGLILFGVGIFTVGMTLPELMSRLDRYYGQSIWKNGLMAYLFTGVGYVVVGVLGLLKTKWFPRLGLSLLALSFLLVTWTWYTELFSELSGEDFYFGLGGLAMGYCFLIILALLFRNENFLAALNKEDEKGEGDDRILDA